MNKFVSFDNYNALTYTKLSIGGALDNIVKENTVEEIFGITLDSLLTVFKEQGIDSDIIKYQNLKAIESTITFNINYGHIDIRLTLSIYDGKLIIERADNG